MRLDECKIQNAKCKRAAKLPIWLAPDAMEMERVTRDPHHPFEF
jgi:hypothetical protein